MQRGSEKPVISSTNMQRGELRRGGLGRGSEGGFANHFLGVSRQVSWEDVICRV